jgi:hypothetical protein
MPIITAVFGIGMDKRCVCVLLLPCIFAVIVVDEDDDEDDAIAAMVTA